MSSEVSRGEETQATNAFKQMPQAFFVFYVIAAAFSTYFCMYAFRKPFLATSYEGMQLWGLDVKSVLAISQIAGYTLSKFVGIKVCSEIHHPHRAKFLIGLILLAEIALVLFAVLPLEYKVVAIFLNGIPLGMVWGLVVLYLEGRRTSEVLLAGLSCSYVVASGAVKDVGRGLMSLFDVGVWWMPATTGMIFLGPFVIAVWMLNRIPPPNEEDKLQRTQRSPMQKEERRAFLRHFGLGIALQLILYFFVTAFRDFRDIYGIEVFSALGYAERPAIFTQSELLVAFVSMAALAGLNLIKSNRYGLLGNYAIMLAGVLFLAGGTFLFDQQMISGLSWVVAIGMGAYLVYIPNGSVFFDRVLASTNYVGTAVFAIYLIDAVGYSGSIAMQLLKDLLFSDVSHVVFLKEFAYFLAVLCTGILVFNSYYFTKKAQAANG